ncbi:MAG: cupredoxin domain-containing protein [Mycobacteriales bacterium]
MTTSRAVAVVLLVLASACSSSSEPTSQPTTEQTTGATAAASEPTITIKGFRYTPLQVAPGTTITVKNLDDAEHTVTSDTKGVFDADDIGGTPKTFTAPTKPGSYNYHCTYHASMHGSLTVT